MTIYTKQYYRLSEVSAMLNLPISTLNYWLQTFDELDPPTTKGGLRRYRPKDIELIKQIQTMMHDKGMQIEGAKRMLKHTRVPSRGYKCRSVEDAAHLIDEVSKMVQDNPKSLAMLEAVSKYLSDGISAQAR